MGLYLCVCSGGAISHATPTLNLRERLIFVVYTIHQPYPPPKRVIHFSSYFQPTRNTCHNRKSVSHIIIHKHIVSAHGEWEEAEEGLRWGQASQKATWLSTEPIPNLSSPPPRGSVRNQNPYPDIIVFLFHAVGGSFFFLFLSFFFIKHLSRQQSQSELFIYSCGFSMLYKLEIIAEWGLRPLTHAGPLSVSPFTEFDCTQSKMGENDMLQVKWRSHS